MEMAWNIPSNSIQENSLERHPVKCSLWGGPSTMAFREKMVGVLRKLQALGSGEALHL